MALRKYAFLTGALTIAILHGCGSDDSAPAATGGAAGTGGGATGGSAGRGGGTGGGATGGASGSTGTGGGATGGSVGTGGTVVDSGPVACSTAPYNNVFRFLGPTSDAWSINSYSTPMSLVPGTNAETGAPTGTLLEVDPNDGSPAPGSVKLTIPFDAPSEQLIFQQLYGNGAPGVNLTGTTISALVKLDSLANGAVSSIVQGAIALKATGGYIYVQGPSINLQTGAWVTVSMSADSAPIMNSSFDNCDVREIDVLILTGSGGTYGTAVVHVDTIAITGADAGVPPEPDGGAPVATEAGGGDAREAGGDAGADRAAESAAPETGGAPDASE